MNCHKPNHKVGQCPELNKPPNLFVPQRAKVLKELPSPSRKIEKGNTNEYITGDSIIILLCYSNKNRYADQRDPIDYQTFYSEEQYNSVGEESMYPEYYYLKFDEDTVDNTINKYELTNEDVTYTYT